MLHPVQRMGPTKIGWRHKLHRSPYFWHCVAGKGSIHISQYIV